MSDRGERESLLLPILIPVGALVVIVVVLYAFSRVLLSVKPNAATAVALVAAAGIMAVAAFVSSRRSVTGASLGSFVGAAAGIAMAAGGIAIVVIGPPEEEIQPFHAALAAPEGAASGGFSTDALAFEAGRARSSSSSTTRIRGSGTTCRSSTDRTTSAPSLFEGEAITGPGEDDLPDRRRSAGG